MRVSTNKYRFFLILLLAAALGGGIWYCIQMRDRDKAPDDGILVKYCEIVQGAA